MRHVLDKTREVDDADGVVSLVENYVKNGQKTEKSVQRNLNKIEQ